jgi:hypothetical protein
MGTYAETREGEGGPLGFDAEATRSEKEHHHRRSVQLAHHRLMARSGPSLCCVAKSEVANHRAVRCQRRVIVLWVVKGIRGREKGRKLSS